MSCSSCGGSNCSGGTSCCGNVQGNSCNQPFYTCAPACAEDHTEKIVINCLSASIRTANPWNIPACGLTAVVIVNGLKAIPIGVNLWDKDLGYFEVIAFDANSSQITIRNNCISGNAAAGTAVPACTEFIITATPCDCGPESDICVAIDFTAPEIDVPLDITVTSTIGLTAGDTVQIGSGLYLVQEIKVNNVITIVNKGSGITPGTSVIAQDASGNYQYCLSIISTNPCDREAQTPGPLLICTEDNIVPLANTGQGRIPYTINNTNHDAEYRPLDSTFPVCTALSAPLNIVAANPGPYSLTVDSSVGFAIGDVLILDNRVDRFTVTGVPDGVTIDGTLSPVPGANATLAAGEVVCQIGCCEELRNEVACIVQGARFSVDPALYNQTITMATPAGGTLARIYEVTLDSNVIQFTAPSDCPGSSYNVRAEINVAALIDMDPYAAAFPTQYAILSNEIQLDWDNNPGVGGRFNWTEVGNDGVDVTGIYPPTTLNAIWGTLQGLAGVFPITYHGSYIIADTVVAAGATITLRLNYKAIEGENARSSQVRGLAMYLIGNLIVSKIT